MQHCIVPHRAHTAHRYMLGYGFPDDVSQATRYRARAGNVPRLDTRQARPQAGVHRRCCIPLPSHG
jgi:hypothetical protein